MKRLPGCWSGLDFDPTTDIGRTVALCPDGWVELYWHTSSDAAQAPGEFSALHLFGVMLDDVDEVQEAIREIVGGLPTEAETWPDGRLCIGRLVYDSGERSVGLAPSWGVELLRNEAGDLVFMDLPGSGDDPP